MDSTALRVLVSVHKRLHETGAIAVGWPPARLPRARARTALDRVPTLTNTVDEALVALKSGCPGRPPAPRSGPALRTRTRTTDGGCPGGRPAGSGAAPTS